jgi:hypothetical protein
VSIQTEKPIDLLRRLVANVTSSQSGKKILSDNPIDQLFVFEVTDGEPFMMSVARGSTDIQIKSGSEPYKYPDVLLCKTDTKNITRLLSGQLRVGRAYVDNLVTLRGQLLAKALLGNLVRINQAILNPFVLDEFKHAP